MTNQWSKWWIFLYSFLLIFPQFTLTKSFEFFKFVGGVTTI